MVRLVSWVRFPQRARRRTSVGQSTRLIIVWSSVRVRPPLPGRSIQPASPALSRQHVRTGASHGQAEDLAEEAAFECGDDGSYRPREDDAHGCDYEDVGGAGSGELGDGVRSD